MVIKSITALIGTYFFLYLYWKKLKDDYTQNIIFTSGIYSLIGIGVFSIVSEYFLPAWIFWFCIAGSIFGLSIGIIRYKMRFYETYEAWMAGILGFFYIIAFYNSLVFFSIFNILFALLVLVVLILFFVVDKHYKNFVWYKSGRVGFTGLFMSGISFLIVALIAIFFPSMVFFQGKVGAIISSVLSFTSFLLLFNLSRKHA